MGRGLHSLLRGHLTPGRGILTILTPVRGKTDQDSERSSFRVQAVPLLSFCCTMHVFHHRFVPLHQKLCKFTQNETESLIKLSEAVPWPFLDLCPVMGLR